jgi:hypothetical protein
MRRILYKYLFRKKDYFQLLRTLLDYVDPPDKLNLNRNARSILKELRSRFGGQNLNVNRLIEHKSSDTVFILACGSSINQMTQDEFKYIKKHETISIGLWLYHDFIPSICTYEITNNYSNKFSKHEIFMLNKLNECGHKYSNTLFLFKSRIPHDNITEGIYDYITKYHKFNWVDTRVIHTKNRSNFIITMGILKILRAFKNRHKFLQYNGSLVWAIFMAYKMGYQRIVLCGVDLKGNYFFESSGESNLIEHSSLQNSRKKLNLIEAILLIEKILLLKSGIRLYRHPASLAFVDLLPIYTDWK